MANSGALLETLARLGYCPEDIDVLAFTHLHPDRTGWGFVRDSQGAPTRTFPAAQYLVVNPEWGPYERGELRLGAPPRADFVEPLAKVVTLVEDGAEVFPGVHALVTPGHSPAHTSYLITGAGAGRVLVFGDVFHMPGQIAHPEWPSAPDIDHKAVRTARRRITR